MLLQNNNMKNTLQAQRPQDERLNAFLLSFEEANKQFNNRINVTTK